MAVSIRRAGDFRTSYQSDRTIFPTRGSTLVFLLALAVLVILPALSFGGKYMVSSYWLAMIIQIGYYGIAALGLNILVGFTGQISLGHSAFFGFGAFASAYLSGRYHWPVYASIPAAGLMTGLLGIVVGLPAARLKGLYLAIATLASQFVLQDFFSRAGWFTGGASGANAPNFKILGFTLSGDRGYYYVVVFFVVIRPVSPR